MELQLTIALVLFLFPLAYSPGPGNSFFAAIGATRGIRAALPALLGYHAATLIVTIVIGMGFGLVFLADPRFVRYLSIAGSLYVLYIAWIFLREGLRAKDGAGTIGATKTSVGFLDGAFVLLLNPKAYLIIGLIFSQFLTGIDDRLAQVLKISTIFTVNNLVAFLVWTIAGASLTRALGSGASSRTINFLFAACLAGVAIWLLLPAFNH